MVRKRKAMKRSAGKGTKVGKKQLSHYDDRGRPRMVDVSDKSVTLRRARAQAFVKMTERVLGKIGRMETRKGDPLVVARLAGIQAAKRTAEWIPLCHPLALSHVDVTTELCKNGIRLTSSVRTRGSTGVEMEALVAVSCAALTLYDMCKALDRGIEIQEIVLLEKTGGASGRYRRPARKPKQDRKRK